MNPGVRGGVREVKQGERPGVAVLATMDTKGAHARWLKGYLESLGAQVVLIDAGVRPPQGVDPDVDRNQVAQAAGAALEEVQGWRRDRIIEHMGRGARAILTDLAKAGRVRGVLAFGGNQGSTLASLAFDGLPIGFPKLLVSTVASGNIRPLVGASDTWISFSVGDFVGRPDPVSEGILQNAAAALWGMVQWGSAVPRPSARPVVAITALGNTEGAVRRCREQLIERGYEVTVFHASGAGGTAMEDLIRQGQIAAVLDLTPHELVGEVFGDDIYAPVKPGRLEAAGRLGLPMVVAPGGLDYFCFGPLESVPPRYRSRPIHYHNPLNMNVRATKEELAHLGQVLAERLNAARGPVGFIIPEGGWTENGRAGGPLHDPEADAALIEAFLRHVSPRVRVKRVAGNLNDPESADVAVALLIELMELGEAPRAASE